MFIISNKNFVTLIAVFYFMKILVLDRFMLYHILYEMGMGVVFRNYF